MNLKNFLKLYIESASGKILEYAPKIVSALLVLAVALAASIIVKKIILAAASKKKLSGQKMEVIKLIGNVSSGTILAIGAVSSLGTLGVNISALVAGLGLSGFALGFALKDVISNLLSGILIILYHPFKIGDIIAVGGFEGEVSEINLRYTVLCSGENTFMIPNASIFTSTVTVKKKNNHVTAKHTKHSKEY